MTFVALEEAFARRRISSSSSLQATLICALCFFDLYRMVFFRPSSKVFAWHQDLEISFQPKRQRNLECRGVLADRGPSFNDCHGVVAVSPACQGANSASEGEDEEAARPEVLKS